MKKLYIVRKYIWATSVLDAIRKDKKSGVDDCWVDEEFKKESGQKREPIGFYIQNKVYETSTN